ncbi:MAG: GFA family protein [Gammaproteobacteria bacterium]|nr:GFA family protein [Gammaproteobacteria bacterium]
MNKGSCLCGDITWEITADPIMYSNCHCSMCRKIHGTAYGAYVAVPAEEFRWISGEKKILSYESSSDGQRPSCPRCGSAVASLVPDYQMVFMPIGNLDGEIHKSLDMHIFVGSKAPWFEITDAAPQHDASPPEYDIPETESPTREPATSGATGGSCLCGAVTFEFDDHLGRMGNCHCSRCRRARSSPHSTQLFVMMSSFRWVQGEDHVKRFKLPDTDTFTTSFCKTCASAMPTVFEDRGMAMVPAGALDQDPGIRPQAHIYIGSKAPWFEITDDLMQFEAMPDMPNN